MCAASPRDTLDLWERASGLRRLDQALALVQFAAPERPWQELAELPVGQRDLLLLELRERIFGGRLEAFVACPACSGEMEFVVSTVDLVAPAPAPSGRAFCYGGVRASLRALNSLDLASALEHANAEDTHRSLAARCVVSLRSDGDSESSEIPIDPTTWVRELPDGAFAELADRLSDMDPQASLELNLRCPACEHAWAALFDIGEYFWEELQRAVGRVASEVHELSSAYHWSEDAILGLSSQRRALYLQVARSRQYV